MGWTALRALPLLMVASQILSSKFTQPSSAPQQGGAQAKLMMYALPIVFLFILYDMPSGLVLYWTVQNILSTVQQVYINNLRKKKDAQSGETPVFVKGSAKPGREGPGKDGQVTAWSGSKETDMIVKEFEGKNEKEAIDRAIEELGLDRNEIDFEIVEAKKPGILFRGRQGEDPRAPPGGARGGRGIRGGAPPRTSVPRSSARAGAGCSPPPMASSRRRSSSSPAVFWTAWGFPPRSR